MAASRQASTRLIWPAPMPIVWRALASTMAFDLTRRTTLQASSHAARSTAVGLRCDSRRHAATGSGSVSASWTRRPPSIRFQSSAAARAAGDGNAQQADVRLLREELDRLLREVVGRHDLDEVLQDERGERAVHAAADRDDAAERRERVARERAAEGLGDGVADGRAARVVVLDDDGGRAVEVARERDGGVEVEQVVEGELLALEHLEADDRVRRRVGLPVERRALVRVLAVAQRAHALEGEHEALGKDVVRRVAGGQVPGDRAVVGRGAREGAGGEPFAASRGSCLPRRGSPRGAGA